MRSLSAVAVLLLAAAGCSGPGLGGGGRAETERRLVLLGFDGFDPQVSREMMAAGELPHLSALAREGSFHSLATSTPPQSPVAWSNVITGTGPGTHGIFDFVHRDPRTMTPYLSTSRMSRPGALDIGPLRVPLGSGAAELLRRAPPFWNRLAEEGVPVRVVKVPANYPPSDSEGAEALAGMGTPDLLGTYGTFTLLTTATGEAPPDGGRVVPLAETPDGTLRAELEGPPHPLRSDGSPLVAEVEVALDRAARAAVVSVGGSRALLAEGEWSEWLPFDFDVVPWLYDVPAMVRVHLSSAGPDVRLVLSPVNADPTDPAMPVASPPSFARRLAREAGRFYTQGMPEDTRAYESGALDRRGFLAQGQAVLDERIRLLDASLDGFDRGFLFFYVSSADPHSHMLWREHAGADEGADDVKQIYRELDDLVGRVRSRLGRRDALVVMSDHGFASFDREVDVNAWLWSQGYLALTEDAGDSGAFADVDWSRTQAYGLGLNGLYLNVAGRERWGIVAPEEREELLDEIAEDLRNAIDPETGARMVSRVFRTDRSLGGPAAADGPDLIVGWARGYRTSRPSARGEIGSLVVAPNEDRWSGDHCIDPALVPGVIFTDRSLDVESPGLLDIAPTVQRFFGLDPSRRLVGRPLWSPGSRMSRRPPRPRKEKGV